ncbi:NAD(P)/FAD-dependent oxidoreductase [Flavisolibacter ginsengisoli]|jgi:flavin-dependent dehydrogenase|uniref:Dehydrogenase (Flavoprotein) n=1 Tax=Flavisolibacter ginsengisoli DSM 18119 TaxID=1121884 RepID=A0A1M4W6Q8_9BACT|nr:FAD-dependent monooxygenase [Flavisolibacter ginsengisoli]SHE76897.1 Dehydrogenase (flavoprotein) [Flavisolibacter ginsengisoli DSM 18119]
MELADQYDVAIIGGGLAGLSGAIELRMAGYNVILFEQEKYPFHKVCGEYISHESLNYLEHLGIPISQMKVPFIDNLVLTAPNGRAFKTALPLGGFGISRYELDNALAQKAKKLGVVVLEETKVEKVEFNEQFTIHFNSRITNIGVVKSKVCCAAWGKKSNIDRKWNRTFLSKNNKRLNNYIAVKYHIRSAWPEGIIGLHNFKDGYCGISNIENGLTCLCYMTTAGNLKKSNNSVEQLEQCILMDNPHLKEIFTSCTRIKEFPITISQINFLSKTKIENHVIMIGDAAGLITPLCGNGMSIALHTGKIVSRLVILFLMGKITRANLEKQYSREWHRQFSKRLRRGRQLQWFFGRKWISNSFVSFFQVFPFLAKRVIRMTHGRPF